jgi:putative transposase
MSARCVVRLFHANTPQRKLGDGVSSCVTSPSLWYRVRMTKPHEYRRDNHCVYLCDYHIVLPTKYRRAVITDALWNYLYGKLVEITEHYPRIYFKEANHDKDHVHILVSIPPQVSVGSVVRLVKTNTARKIKEKFPVLKQYYWGTDSFWSEGYFVSTVGITTDIIKRYIEKQGDRDTGQTATLFD